MDIHELVLEMKVSERRLTLYEEKYGILSRYHVCSSMPPAPCAVTHAHRRLLIISTWCAVMRLIRIILGGIRMTRAGDNMVDGEGLRGIFGLAVTLFARRSGTSCDQSSQRRGYGWFSHDLGNADRVAPSRPRALCRAVVPVLPRRRGGRPGVLRAGRSACSVPRTLQR